jgi:hypothetical protein
LSCCKAVPSSFATQTPVPDVKTNHGPSSLSSVKGNDDVGEEIGLVGVSAIF